MESGNIALPNQPDRLGLVTSLLAEMRYDAVGVGENDLLVSRQFFGEAQKSKLTVIDPRPDAPKTAVPSVIKDVDGVKVGIVSFGGVGSGDTVNEYERRKAMYGAYRTARQASDVLIALDQGNVVTAEWLDRIGKRLGAPDVVVAGARKSGLAQPEIVGKTYICPTGIQGKQMGFVDIEFTRGSDSKLVWSRVDLDENVVEDEMTKAKITASLRPGAPASAQAPLPAAHAASATATSPEPVSRNKLYYSSELCKSCHLKHYEDWAATKHASATKTLMDAGRKIPECLQCHSEQYRRTQIASVPGDGNGGVECAACHADALPHGLERKAVAVKTRVSALGCLECHTKERSAGYDEQVYFPKVSHLSAKAAKTASTSIPNP